MVRQVSAETEFTEPLFGSRRHIAFIYDHLDDQDAATGAFIKEGLERRQFCLYVHDEGSEAAILDSLAAAGVNTATAISDGRLGLADTRTAFLAGGRFDSKAMVSTLQATVDRATQGGLEGLFVAGEMTWALGPHPGTERLMEYEALCNRFFLTNPAVSLCQYDRRRFDDQAIGQVLLTHPWVLIGGRLCRNLHHIPPEEFLAAGEDLPLDVDQVLADLVIRDAAERMVSSTTALEGVVAVDMTTDDARRMVTIYSELEEFKVEVLSRTERRASFLSATRPRTYRDDTVLQLRGELAGLRHRLEFWRDTLRQMVQLDHDAARRVVRFNGRSVRLSRRESQLIEALISSNGRPLSVRELLRRAWGGSQLSEAQLRTYIVQLRRKLAMLEVPAALVNKPGVGYALHFDSSLDSGASRVLTYVETIPAEARRAPAEAH